jgi:23S rRNA (uracil1939-C5)-methyltransferase
VVVSLPQERRQLRLQLTGMGRLGEALGEVEGKQVFVFGGIPGETVVVEVLREHRSYIAAQTIEVLEPSPHRVAPPCPFFGPCTGCQWQHIDYAYQLELKREIVRDALERVGGLRNIAVADILPSPQTLGYRNHARFTVSREGGRLGFVNRATRERVAVDQCLLMTPWINETLAALQGHVGETTQLSLRCGVNQGTGMIQPRLHTLGLSLASGQETYEEELLGHRFRVSSPSFFQVNTPQAEQVAELVIKALALKGHEVVVDAYAGVGTFSVLLASHVRKVVAIEESSSALADAKQNVAATPNVELRRGKTEQVLAEVAGDGIDAVVLDPPRAGCLPGTLEALVAVAPQRIVYVSCDPETLARDLAALTRGPYRIEHLQPVDMFPQTHHVESVTTLVLDADKQAKLVKRDRLVLASASPRRREVLTALGLTFEVVPSDAEEPPGVEDGPVAFAEAQALRKARAVATIQASGTVIGADTVVVLDGQVLGKPGDSQAAVAMLKALRGREHQVVTGVALVDAATGEALVDHCSSRVVMRDYTDDELAAYVASGDSLDKAGAYAVQSESFSPAAEVHGCYLNVVGLPVCTLLKLLDRFGVVAIVSGESWTALVRCPECVNAAGRGGWTGKGA